MSESLAPVAPPAMPSDVSQLLRLVSGYAVSQAISVMARLGVADQLANGPMPVAEIAEGVGAEANILYRLLRGLVGTGVITELDNRCFALTAMGEWLRRESGSSLNSTEHLSSSMSPPEARTPPSLRTP